MCLSIHQMLCLKMIFGHFDQYATVEEPRRRQMDNCPFHLQICLLKFYFFRTIYLFLNKIVSVFFFSCLNHNQRHLKLANCSVNFFDSDCVYESEKFRSSFFMVYEHIGNSDSISKIVLKTLVHKKSLNWSIYLFLPYRFSLTFLFT